MALFGITRLLRVPLLASLLILLIFAALVLWPVYTGEAQISSVFSFNLQLAGFFAAGGMACLLRRHVPISTGLMALILAACLLMRSSPNVAPLMWLAVGYFVFWFSYVPRIPSIPRGLDLSYGVYLWAFPTQQTVVLLGGATHPIALFAIVAPIVLVIGAVSWLCIEKPALRLKTFRWQRTKPLEDRSPNSSVPIGSL